ncbi:MAG: YhdP family protein [Thiohalomonadaceae bacterium]
MKPLTPLQRARRLLEYGIAAVLVLAAVLLTAMRLVLPHAADYRAQVEAWVSAYLGQPVRIERMDARLLVLSPTLVLDGVELLEPSGARPLARLASLHIGIAPLDSLRTRSLVMSELTVVGARLAVERRKDGSLQIEGISLQGAAEQSDDPLAVGRWLLTQHRLTLRESSLLWRDRVTGRERAFEQVTLELRNDGNRHRLDAALHLSEDLGSTLHIAADLRGDLLHLPSVKGDLYAAVERGRPAGVLALLPFAGLPRASGEVTARAWGRWDGRLRAVEGEFRVENLSVSGPEGPFIVDQMGARFAWRHEAGENAFDVDDLMVVRAGRRWEPARLRLRYTAAPGTGLGPLHLQASFLRLEDLAAAAELFPLPPEGRRQLREAAVAGDLRDVRLAWNGSAWSGAATFRDLALAPAGKRPGVEGLDGRAWYGDGEAGVTLATRDAHLLLPRLFRDPLPFTELSGVARLHRDGPAWRLAVPAVSARNDDISARASLVLTLPDAGSPHLDLVGDYRDGRATSVYRYLPAHIMPAATVKWLDRAFKEGRVARGQVLFHGRLADFPFDDDSGRFEVRFDAEDVLLDYMPHWPRLHDIDGEVVFDGRGMRIEARSARVMNSAVDATVVTIPDLRRARLFVKGRAEGPFADLLDYLRATGLAGPFDEALARFAAGGRSVLSLDFEQPLSARDERPARVGGAVQFLDATLRVAEGVEFHGIRGTLEFEDKAWRADALTGRLFGEPVSAMVEPRGEVTLISLAGTALGESLAARFPSPLTARLDGRAGWNGRITLGRGETAETTLVVESTLEGMAVPLPPPLGKPHADSLPLTVTAFLSGERAGQAEAVLAGRGSAVWELAGGELARLGVHLGEGHASLPEGRAVRITGRLPALVPAQWSGMPGAAAKRPEGAAAPLPVQVELEELGLVLDDGADAGVKAKSAGGWGEASLPPLTFRVEKLSVDGKALGRLEFNTVPGPGQMVLREFSLRGPLLEVTGTGHWRRGPAPRTQVDLAVFSPDLGKLARSFGFASAIGKGRMNAELKFAWPGAPQAYEMARLDGSVSVKIREGVLEEVDPGAGRLLGLLSLEALPRRLLLDFRDLFEKGVRFRTLQGSFRIENGNAYTSNLRVDTLPAGVFVSGRTGLAARDYDHTITVIPEVSGTLPVAGGLALGPQVGAVLLLFQSIFKDKIDEAALFRYTVTGTWEKPVVKRIQ